jgi:hypothetical protein
MEGKLWDLLIEISTGLPNIAPITQDPQGTSSGPSSGQHKISTARLKQAILNAREEMAKFQGIEATASMTRTVPLKKKEKKVPAHDFEALRGENESLKGESPDQLSLRSTKLIIDSTTSTCPRANEGFEN